MTGISSRGYGFLLAVYLGLLAFILFQPVPTVASGVVTHVTEWLVAMGVPQQFTAAGRVEAVLNAAMFAPAAALAALTWPRQPWTAWVTYAFAGSVLVEVLQALLLSARSAQVVDVVANTAGAFIGALGVHLLGRAGRSTQPEQ